MQEEDLVLENVKRCLVIVNPTSGRERAPKYIPLLSSVLSKRYDDVSIKLTQKAGDAKDFARRAAEKNKDIICMGGDGTINEVINGMVPVRSDSCFGFIPFGTVNDLARALHIPRSPQGAIRMLEQAKRTTIDVGKINDRYFINIVAAGLIPEAVSEVTIKEKTLFGSLAYFMKGFQALPKQHSYHFHIREENGTISIFPPLWWQPCSPIRQAASAISSRRKKGTKASSNWLFSIISNGSAPSVKRQNFSQVFNRGRKY